MTPWASRATPRAWLRCYTTPSCGSASALALSILPPPSTQAPRHLVRTPEAPHVPDDFPGRQASPWLGSCRREGAYRPRHYQPAASDGEHYRRTIGGRWTPSLASSPHAVHT